MPHPDEPRYVTALEAARILGISVTTLHRWAQAGRLESARTAGGDRFFPRDVVDRLARDTGRDPLGPNGGDA